MRNVMIGVLLACFVPSLLAQDAPPDLDKKAQKSFQQGLENSRNPGVAIYYFRDADKQDHGHCLPCQEKLVQIGLTIPDWKAVEDGATGMASQVKEPMQQAVAHYYVGLALKNQGAGKHQEDLLARAHDEFTKSLTLNPGFVDPTFEDGKTLALLHRDSDAKVQFERFLATSHYGGEFRKFRAEQFIKKPDLARANLVPELNLVTSDSQRVTVESLAGKVALVQFWSMSCDVCARDFLRLKKFADEFKGQPFVILNVSVDYDMAAWRAFLQKNEIPGLHFIDGFNGSIAQAFGVGYHFESEVQHPVGGTWQSSQGLKQEVPKTFTIDADGVLQPEKFSDSLESTLRGLLARTSQNRGESH